MSNWFKRNSIHFIIAGIFIVICFLYFTPAFQGKTLGQSDVIGAQSTQTEINAYKAKDTTILWTNQIFGGMPAFQIWAPYPDNLTTWIVKVVTDVLPNPLYIVFILFFGAYFLFSVFKLNPWLAAAGAIAFTFSSYNIILLSAGHSNQAFAICFFAPILASIILALRGNYWLGGSLTAFFLAMEIRANHIQMTYYLLIVILILMGFELYRAVRKKATATLIKSLVFIAIATVLAVAVNASLLWSTYDYGTETIRGKSNLTQHTKEPSNGLSKDYAYEYSQTVGETLTFLVPNAYGGETGLRSLDLANSDLVKTIQTLNIPQQQAEGLLQGLSSYWGDKPLTSGPHYMGAVICFLFIYGLLIVKSRLKWWLLASVILTVLLSFGNSFPYVSDLFFNYFPLYNKFRAIESILSVTGLCICILALLAVNEIIIDSERAVLFKKLKMALYITGGLTVLLIIYPELLLSFKQGNQAAFITQLSQYFGGNNDAANSIMNALVRDRQDIERSDAMWSLAFILVSFGVIWAFLKNKLGVMALSIIFPVLILADLWRVDKRFLREDSFQDKQDIEQVVKPRESVDNNIMMASDRDPDYRVFDLTAGIKQDTYSPFFHKSIGGYSAARLKRFDELIDNQLSTNPPNHDVIDMLNTKYIITADTGRNYRVVRNETACGHAWFVKSVKYADNADQEMQAISSFDPKNEAIVDKRYKKLIDEKPVAANPNATIKLVNYTPDHLTYQSGSTTTQIAVFSEIYYNKGWKMYIDGQEAPYFRADYVLRAAEIPVGNHKIEWIFHPVSYYAGEKISLAGSALLLIALAFAVYMETRRRKGLIAEPVVSDKKVSKPIKK